MIGNSMHWLRNIFNISLQFNDMSPKRPPYSKSLRSHKLSKFWFHVKMSSSSFVPFIRQASVYCGRQEFSPQINNISPSEKFETNDIVENGEPYDHESTNETDQFNGDIVEVESNYKLEVPVLLRQLQGQIVELGVESVTFSCEFKNATGVGWSFNGKALAPDDKYDIIMEGRNVILTVKDVGLEDSGIYVCYAINKDGRVTTVGYLSVRGKCENKAHM